MELSCGNMSSYPNIPKDINDKRFGSSVSDAIFQLTKRNQELEARVASITKQSISQPSTPSSGATQQTFDPTKLTQAQINQLAAIIGPEIQSTGSAPIHVEQLLGALAQPQLPGVPYFPTTPPTSDPSAQDGALVLVGSGVNPTPATATLMRWDGSQVDPPKLVAVGAAPPPPVSGYQVLRQFLHNVVTLPAFTPLNLGVLTLPSSGFLNTPGKCMRIRAGGLNSLTANAIFSVQIVLSASPAPNPATSITLSTFIPATTTNVSGNLFWELELDWVTTFANTGAFISKFLWNLAPSFVTSASPATPLLFNNDGTANVIAGLVDVVIVGSLTASGTCTTEYFTVELLN